MEGIVENPSLDITVSGFRLGLNPLFLFIIFIESVGARKLIPSARALLFPVFPELPDFFGDVCIIINSGEYVSARAECVNRQQRESVVLRAPRN